MINYCPPEVNQADAILVFRMHWFDRLRRIAGGAVIFMIGLLTVIFLPVLAPGLPSPWTEYIYLAATLFMLLGWGIAGYGLTLYYLTVATVTKTSIVDVDQISLFNRKVSTLNLEQVQDVTVRQVGFFATFLDFGDVVVQTAGELPEFIFDLVPHPQAIANSILEAQQHRDQKHEGV